jgi:hypothetical protein
MAANRTAKNKVRESGIFFAAAKHGAIHHVLTIDSPQCDHVLPSKNTVEIAKPLVKSTFHQTDFFLAKTVESKHGNKPKGRSGLPSER